MVQLVRELADQTEVPIVVRANAGLPILVDGEVSYPESPAEMASFVPILVEAGAHIIGGCCGTTPDHIRAISAELRRARQTRLSGPPA